MAEQFSAAYYMKLSDNELRAEANRLGLKIDGYPRIQMINAVYNAELRRRGEEQAAREAEEAKSRVGTGLAPTAATDRLAELEAENARLQAELKAARQQRPGYIYGKNGPVEREEWSNYEAMTVKELRDLAEQRGVDLGEASRKADIIEALETDDRNRPNPDAEAMKG